MKLNPRTILILGMTALPCITLTAQEPFFLQPKEVTVYLNGVLLLEETSVQFQKGTNSIKLLHCSDAIQTERMALSVPDGVSILYVNRFNIDQKPTEYISVLREINDSINQLHQKTEDLKAEKSICDKERELLNKNMQVSGSQTGLNLEELRKTADFFRQRLEALYQRETKINKEINRNQEHISRLNKNYQKELKESGVTKTGIELTYFAGKNTQGMLSLGYTISQAGWSPFYNLRVEDLNKDLELEYMASVHNRSGKDWKDVKLRLSTHNPFQSAGVPNLERWLLDFNNQKLASDLSNQYVLRERDKVYRMKNEAVPMGADMEDVTEKLPATVIKNTALSLEYELGGTYNLPHGGSEQRMVIRKTSINGSYRHLSIPKVDKDAFLICSVKNWNQLELMEGTMFLYLEGSYVGSSYIQTRYAGDSMDLSLGRDKKVVVNRVKQSAFSKKNLLGGKMNESRSYEIKVRNLRNTAINMELIDQIPVSLRSEIEVNATELSNAVLNKDSGALTWKFDLQPNATKTIKLAFDVRYPKDQPIDID